MTELERGLVELGANLDYPATPDLAGAIRRRLAAGPARRGRLINRRRLVIAVALLAVAVGAAFAVPQARAAILEFLGLRGATVERVQTLPEAPVAADLDLGELVTLEEARRRVPFPILVPEALGPPDEVYVADDLGGPRVTLAYAPSEGVPESSHTGVGFLLTEFRGALAPELIAKLAGSGSVVEEVSVDGSPGIWLEGEPHVFFYLDENGEFRDETLRLAGNTLLWERGELLLRIEAQVDREAALEIAASLR